MKDYEHAELDFRRERLAIRLAKECEKECNKVKADFEWKCDMIRGASAVPKKGQTVDAFTDWREPLYRKYCDEAAVAMCNIWLKYHRHVVEWNARVVAGGCW